MAGSASRANRGSSPFKDGFALSYGLAVSGYCWLFCIMSLYRVWGMSLDRPLSRIMFLALAGPGWA